ncbi:hypothetical protein [Pseudonocardia sp.]|jgi:hypothetical protein|uniref:hypothetical protein n=1 Tax=Pseudonocardia sp. TaxID=60912 RepID=UPI0031FBF98F
MVDRFLAMKKIRHHRIVLEVAGECSGEPAARLERALRRYCELRIQRAERQSEVIWRSGMPSLVSGSLLFIVGVVLSFEFTRPGAGLPRPAEVGTAERLRWCDKLWRS